ncbi:DMT family transporter [Candidatus Spongiisocius sp.]|uniref:DMT family transporter n=1 Tax=Candidatus Spongiisocius sp. TaxID=3101273 RepID=UPI003B5CD5F2
MARRSPITALRGDGLGVPLLAMTTSIFVMSTGLVAIKATSLSGLQFSLWRLWVGVVVLGLVVMRRITAKPEARPSLSSLRWAIWPGLLVAFSQPAFVVATKLTSVTDVALLTSVIPMLVSVIAVPMLGERPGARFRLWVAVAIVGTGLVAYGGSTGLGGDPLGMALAGAAVICWAFYMVILKISRAHLDAIVLLWAVLTIAAICLTVFMAFTGWDPGSVTTRDWLLIAYVAVIPGGVGLALMTWSYGWLPANIPPLIQRAEPVLSSAQAHWLLSEPVTALHFVGGGIAIAGVVGAVLDRSGQRLMTEAQSKADLSVSV